MTLKQWLSGWRASPTASLRSETAIALDLTGRALQRLAERIEYPPTR